MDAWIAGGKSSSFIITEEHEPNKKGNPMFSEKRRKRRRDTAYAPLTATIKPSKKKALAAIARKHFRNRSEAVERAIDLLIGQYGT